MRQISKIYFVTKLYMFRASIVPIIGSYHCTIGNWYVSCRLEPDPPRKRPHKLHETYQLPRVQLITPDDGHRRCPKHVEFRDKINFGYLMHLVGHFIGNKTLK
jgi:hypothetical protein